MGSSSLKYICPMSLFLVPAFLPRFADPLGVVVLLLLAVDILFFRLPGVDSKSVSSLLSLSCAIMLCFGSGLRLVDVVAAEPRFLLEAVVCTSGVAVLVVRDALLSAAVVGVAGAVIICG
jgi:hypothetical protein